MPATGANAALPTGPGQRVSQKRSVGKEPGVSCSLSQVRASQVLISLAVGLYKLLACVTQTCSTSATAVPDENLDAFLSLKPERYIKMGKF